MKKTRRMLTDVYLFANGMVMAFDQFGRQMPRYQGQLAKVRAKIEAAGKRIPPVTPWPIA